MFCRFQELESGLKSVVFEASTWMRWISIAHKWHFNSKHRYCFEIQLDSLTQATTESGSERTQLMECLILVRRTDVYNQLACRDWHHATWHERWMGLVCAQHLIVRERGWWYSMNKQYWGFFLSKKCFIVVEAHKWKKVIHSALTADKMYLWINIRISTGVLQNRSHPESIRLDTNL